LINLHHLLTKMSLLFMNAGNKTHLLLIIWIVTLIAIGGAIGSLTKPEISTWYSILNRSSLTPPNYVFPVAWTILYGIIGTCGWLIWCAQAFPKLKALKTLYVTQLILNWSWTPLFFHYHLTGLSLAVLITMDLLVSALIFLVYPKIRSVSLLMTPYLLWILFATNLNFYIWWCN
jgi:benzodiazapine receptor